MLNLWTANKQYFFYFTSAVINLLVSVSHSAADDLYSITHTQKLILTPFGMSQFDLYFNY